MRSFSLLLIATTSALQLAHRTPPARAAMRAPLPVAISVEAPKQLERREMDERIFGFNKALIDTVYEAICFFYPVTGSDRDFARFFVLETVARVPYFAYLSVMHLRETFGDRDTKNFERMRTHYAEADNELHHLLIMESLGGNSSLVDRTLAQAMAFGYYWYVTIVYFVSEPAAYHLSELIEDHAFYTYDNYLKGNAETLKSKPVPAIATKYYEKDDPFMFNTFCTVTEPDEDASSLGSRPKLESLYDVFVNVRNDEREHWKTLCNLVQFDDQFGTGGKVASTKAAPAELGAA
jgi:ubiquinol oxidase